MKISQLLATALVALSVPVFVPDANADGANEPIPSYYQEPGLSRNRAYVDQHLSERIDPFTGKLQLHHVDLFLPGNGGMDLKVQRSYNSLGPGDRPVERAGVGWTMHFGRVLRKANYPLCDTSSFNDTSANPVLEMPDGSREIMYIAPDGYTFITKNMWRGVCSEEGLSVYSPDGTRYDMGAIGPSEGSGLYPVNTYYVSKITDRNNNTFSFTYVPQGPKTVTASDNRQVTFNYNSAGLVASVSDGSRTWNYEYVAVPNVYNAHFLTKVHLPDGTSWTYAYHQIPYTSPGSLSLKSVTYPAGGQVEYTYGFVSFSSVTYVPSSTVVIKKVATPGGTWNWTYAPATQALATDSSGNVTNMTHPTSSDARFDRTTVTGPEGSRTFYHAGFTSVHGNARFLIGQLLATSSVEQKEFFTTASAEISKQSDVRPGDPYPMIGIRRALIARHVISRSGQDFSTSYQNFDQYGNPKTIAETGNDTRTTQLTYFTDLSKWIIHQRKDESYPGSSITRTFDVNGNLKSIVRDGVTTSYNYDSQGNVASIVFPRSLTHNYTNYKRGIPQSETQPLGISITRVVSNAGNVTSETNGEGHTTSYTYDGLNRLTSIKYPVGNAVNISYTPTSKTATRGSLVEATVYDGFGRTLSVTLGGIKRSFTVDALGRTTFESNPGATIGTSYQYDILDRLKRVENADGTALTITYGTGTKTVTDERGKATTYAYRSYGDPDQQLLMSITAPDTSANVSLARNSKGLVTSATQAGLTRSYGYNSNYYLTSVTDPETGTTTYGRDAAGNMTSRTVGTSGTTDYVYDSHNRLTSVTYPGNTPAVAHTYNKVHKMLTATSSGGNREFVYDANGNLTTEKLVVDGRTFTASYGYNTNDQLSTITYPMSGRVVSYTPDVLGRPTQVSGYVSDVSYWPSGLIKQIDYANGAVSTYGQNARLWPSSFKTSKTGGSTYLNSSYQYDGVGNLTAIADTADSSYNRALGFDNINRLTSVSGPWGAGSITYNGAGNITKQSLGAWNLSYAYSSNRLSAVSGGRTASFGYDAYGNITSDGTNTYTYDDVPNLRCVNCGNAANKVEYTYDGAGHRSSVLKGGIKTYEMTDSRGLQLIEFTPAQANKLVEYIHLGGKRIAQHMTDDLIATVTTLTVSANPASVGQLVTLTAIVTGQSPTGTVTFFDGANPLGTASLVNGQATLNTSFASPGIHNLTAKYAGSSTAASSMSSVLAQTVKYATSTVLSASPNPAIVNHTITFNAAVSGSGSSSGTVTFKNGSSVLGAANVNNGTATFSIATLPIGYHTITATYGGNEFNFSSISTIYNQIVNDKTTSVTSFANFPSYAQIDKVLNGLNVEVQGKSPTGAVNLKDGAAVLGTASVAYHSASGKYYASFSNVAFDAAGTHTLIAEYPGDASNKPSTASMTVKIDTYDLNAILIPIRMLLED